MKKYEIFRSEGGYRLCLSTWNDGPVMDNSPWFETMAEAEKAREDDIKNEAKQRHIEELVAAGDIDALEALHG